jgi:hypothetical protein
MKRILCYGDSNTWGQNHLDYKQRYDEKIRWTKLLADHLQLEYEIIEEGLRARTAGQCEDIKQYRNGLSYFEISLLSHDPLDLIIISLGTNDLKKRYKKSAKEIFTFLDEYRKIAYNLVPTVPIWFINLPIFTASDPEFACCNAGGEKLNLILEQSDFNVINISDVQIDSQDGLHYTPQNHKQVAHQVLQNIMYQPTYRN